MIPLSLALLFCAPVESKLKTDWTKNWQHARSGKEVRLTIQGIDRNAVGQKVKLYLVADKVRHENGGGVILETETQYFYLDHELQSLPTPPRTVTINLERTDGTKVRFERAKVERLISEEEDLRGMTAEEILKMHGDK